MPRRHHNSHDQTQAWRHYTHALGPAGVALDEVAHHALAGAPLLSFYTPHTSQPPEPLQPHLVVALTPTRLLTLAVEPATPTTPTADAAVTVDSTWNSAATCVPLRRITKIHSLTQHHLTGGTWSPASTLTIHYDGDTTHLSLERTPEGTWNTATLTGRSLQITAESDPANLGVNMLTHFAYTLATQLENLT